MNVEYILRQVEPGLADPLVIYLNEEENFIGRQMIPELTKYIKVSRMHGYIKKRGTEFHIRDLGSLNGVYVNGIKIEKELHKLEIGDYIGFGAPSFNDGGFACTFTAKVTSPGEVKREKSALQELEENPQKKIKQEGEELEPEANKVLLENKLQELEHAEGVARSPLKIKDEIVETEDIASEANLKIVSYVSLNESSDKLNKHIFDKCVPPNYEETSGMASDQSGIFLSTRDSDKEKSKVNGVAGTELINKTFKASQPDRMSNSMCQLQIKQFNDMEDEIFLSGCSHSGIYIKHVINNNIPCFIKKVDLRSQEYVQKHIKKIVQVEHNYVKCHKFISSKQNNQPIEVTVINLSKNKEESFKEQSNYVNVNIKERNNVGMASSSKIASDESKKKAKESNLIKANELEKSSSDRWRKSICNKNLEKEY